LFVGLGVRRWGLVAAEERRVDLHDAFEPGDEDLVDIAVVRALLTGASVYVVPQSEVPNGEGVAALLRY